MLAKTTGAFPAELQGTITLTGNATTAWTVGNWAYVGTWASATFKGKVVKSSTTSDKVVVKRISGVLASADALKERVAAGGSDGAATGTVATINTSVIGADWNGAGGLNINYGGWNLRETAEGITRSKVVDTDPLRIIAEVLVAQKNLSVKRIDIGQVPTFTLTAMTSTGPYDISLGHAITFTITSTEGVKFDPATTFPLNIHGGRARVATYLSSNAANTVHTFRYAVATGDEQTASNITIAAANFTGAVYDIVDGNNVVITAPVSVTGTSLTETVNIVA